MILREWFSKFFKTEVINNSITQYPEMKMQIRLRLSFDVGNDTEFTVSANNTEDLDGLLKWVELNNKRVKDLF